MTPAEKLKNMRVELAAFKKQIQQLSQQVVTTQKMLTDEQQLRAAVRSANRNLKAEILKLKSQIQTLQAANTDKANLTATNAVAPATESSAANPASSVSPAPTAAQPPEKATATTENKALSVESLKQALDHANGRIAQLEQTASASSKTKVSFVKANQKKPRKKRAADQNGVRRYQTPTEPIIEHKLQECKACGGAVSGGYFSRGGKFWR